MDEQQPWNEGKFVALLCAWYEQHPEVEKPARQRIWEFVKADALRSLLDDQTIQWEKSHLEGDWCEPRLVKFIKIKDISDKMKALARGSE